MIVLHAPGARVVVDPEHGGRLASFTIDDRELLVTTADESIGWGCYPMVPFAGRLRHGRFEFDGNEHRLPPNLPPHAIHGTLLDRRWSVVETATSSCRLRCEFAAPWPFDGTVEHVVELSDHSLDLTLVVDAEDRMPIQVGWHPWFVKPKRTRLRFGGIHVRDSEWIAADASTRPVPPLEPGTIDDCFDDPQGVLTIGYDDLVLELSSTCRYWVVYDGPSHATCVEPQSGPPNAFGHDPDVVEAGDEFVHRFGISWTRADG